MTADWKQRALARNRTRLILILLLGVVLRTATLFNVELDRDEIWSMRQSRVNLTVELNHTFHLILVAPFTRSLPDVVGIRIVSFWAGLIAIAASARLGFRLGGWTVALWTALLVAISPYLIAYSQEGRDYMLCTALVALGLAFWLESRPW